MDTGESVVGRFRIPLVMPFRGVTEREGLIVAGPAGHGEVSPFPTLTGGPEQAPHYLAAIEAAAGTWEAAVRDVVPVHATIPAVPPDGARALVEAFGCPSVKVKIADGDDEARIEAVRDALGAAGRISVDANGAWDVETAVSHIKRLERYGIELVEQPCASIDECAEVRARVGVAIALDESLTLAVGWRGWTDLALGVAGAETLAPLARVAEAADALVLKVQRLGGVANALRVVEHTGVPGIASSLIETSIGLSAGLALAAALPELPYACGIGTQPLLSGDLSRDPLVPERGVLRVRNAAFDPELLARYEVTDA